MYQQTSISFGWLTSKQAATLLQLRSRWSVRTVRMKTFSPSHSSHLSEPVGSVSMGIFGVWLWGNESSVVSSHALCSLILLFKDFAFSSCVAFWPFLKLPLSPVSLFPPPVYSSTSLSFRHSFSHFYESLFLVYSVIFNPLNKCFHHPSQSSFHILPDIFFFHCLALLTSIHLIFLHHHALFLSFLPVSVYYIFPRASQKRFHWPLWITQTFMWFMALVRPSGVSVYFCIPVSLWIVGVVCWCV